MLKRYEALRIVRDYSSEIWRKTLGSEEHAAIVEIFKWPDLTPVHVSRTLNYGSNPYAEFVDELQSNDEAALALAGRLGLPSLDFEDGSALVRHLDSLKKTADVPDFCEVTPADIDEFQLAPSEFDVVEILARELLDRQLPLIHWAAGFESGGRFLASCLPVHPRAASRYRRFFVIGPSSLTAPFELELKKVASELGITPGGGSLAVSLLTALQEHHALLIICGIDAVDNNKRLKLASVFRDLLDAAKDLGTVPAGKLTPLLYVGQAKAPRHVQRYPVLGDIDAANAVPSVDRSEMFYLQWLRFTKLRGFDPAGEIGSRLRRAEWHYDDIRSRTVSPISIRVRAFFASNLDNYAFFDPTSGFKALAGGQPELPRDVAFFVDDVQRHLRLLKQDRPKRNPELRMLRAVSTAKYWLTPEALADLLDSSIEEAMEEGKALDLLEIDGQAKNPDVNPGEKHYVLNIGVKALIQDHWRAADAADVVDDADAFRSRSDRSIAHLKVAKRLYEKRTDRQILSKEFPFDPHWGRHRIHIVSEVLRHLVRACDTAPLELRPPLKERMVDEAGFPSKLVDGATYCDPRVIINFCFKELYRKELNGDETRFRRRELTKLHGAYVLAMELFQLMSQPGQFGMPHWALDSQYHKSFRLEAGYAALNVGQFPQATYCFGALVEQAERANDPLGQADALLHLTLSQLAQYDLAGAARTINIVERKLSDVQTIDDGLHEHWLKSLKGRVARRKAHLLYLRGDHVRALRELVDIFGVDDEAPAIDKPELATIFIDLLERNEIRDEVSEAIGKPLQDALGVCSLVMFRAMSAGLQHEAMRYKIAFARLLRGRNLRVAAENVLDGVHVDIANYGCSERTYLAFLLEAGDTLLADGRPVRAVVTYLAGCAERAAARGFWREWESAVDLSLTALRAALEKARMDAEAWDHYLETEVAAEQRYRKKDLPNKVGPFARDPLWGYSLTDSDAQYEIARFKPDYIEEKIAELTSAKASQSQAMERRTGRAATSTSAKRD